MNPIDTLDALEAKLQPPGTQPPVDPYAGDNSFVRGIRSGGFGAGSQLSTLAGAVGETLGADQFAKAAYAKGRGLRDDASRAAPLINQWSDVHGAGDFGSYVAGQVGASLPAAAGALGAAALTGGAAVPSMLAAGAAMAPLEIGDVVQRQHDRGEATDLGTAALYGGGSAALQGIVPGMARVKLGGGLGASARQTLRQAVVKESAAIPEQAVLGTAGEGLKQYGTAGEFDTGALGEAFASNAAGGLPFAAAGVAGRAVHGGAGVPGSQMVGDAFAKGREALKEASKAVGDAVPRTEGGGIDLGSIKESVEDTARRVANGVPLREHMDKIRAAAEDMLPDTAMAEAKDRMTKATTWAGDLVNDAGLTPEVRANVAAAAKDLTKDANVKIVAGAMAAREAGKSALGAIGDFYKSVTEKFTAGKAKVDAQYEGGIDVGPKQSRVYDGMRQAIANIIAPIVEQNYPQALHDPAARNRLAEALRVTAERMSQGKEIPAEHQRYMRILFGDEYTDVLGAIGEEMVDSGKTPKFMAQLNKLDAAEAENKSRRQRLAEALPDHSRDELSQIDEQLQRFMSPEFTRGLDRATAELRLRNARRQIAKTFGDKADVILEAYGPQAREENQLQAAGRPLEADKADDGVDFTDRLEEGDTNIEVVSKKPVLSPGNAMKEYGDAPGQTKAEREIARAEKREGVRARWVDATEYAKLTGKDAGDVPEGHGFVVAETLPAGDALSARELSAMKWDKQKQSRDAGKNDTLFEVGPHKFDAVKVTRVMLATLPSDERGSQVRAADAFMQGVAKLTQHYGDVVNVPDSTPIIKNGKKTFTYGEAKKLNLNEVSEGTAKRDKAADEMRNEQYAQLAELRKRWKDADPKRREFLANEAKKIADDIQERVAKDQVDGRMDFDEQSDVTDLTRQDAQATKAAGLLKELRKRVTAGEAMIEMTGDAKLRAKYRAWVHDAESEIKHLEKVDARRGADDSDAEREVGRDEEIHVASKALKPSELRNKFSLDGTPTDKGGRVEPLQYDPYTAIAAARKNMDALRKQLDAAPTAQERARLRAKVAESNDNIGKQEAAEGQITPAGLKVLGSALATMKARVQDAASARDTGSAKVVTQSAIERNAYTKLIDAATQHIAALRQDPGAMNSVQTRNLIAALHPDQKLSAAMELMPPVKARPAAPPARDVLGAKPKLDAMVASENYSALDTRPKVDEFLKRAEARFKELSTERERLFKADEDLPPAQQAAFAKLSDMFGEGSTFDRESLYDGLPEPMMRPWTAADDAKYGTGTDVAPRSSKGLRDTVRTATKMAAAGKEEPPSPKALAAKKAAFLDRARSGDKALIEEIGASTDIKGMQRAIDALPADAAPGVVDAFNARMGELLRDENNSYGALLKKYTLVGTTEDARFQAETAFHDEAQAAMRSMDDETYAKANAKFMKALDLTKDEFSGELQTEGNVDFVAMREFAEEHGLENTLYWLNKSDTAQSRQRTNPQGTTTPQQRTEVTNYIRDVLGPTVKTVFANIMHAGEFEPGRPGVDDIVRVSVHSLNPMSVAYHESLHGLFARLMGTGDTNVVNVLKRAADGAVIKNQLRKLLAGEPDALRQLEDPEERAAYMYQFWATKDANGKRLLEVGTQTHGVFERIKAALLKVLGVWTNDERALHIMAAFHDGKFKDPATTSAAARAIMAAGRNATLDRVGTFTQPLRHLGESIVASGGAKLRETGVPALSDVANGMKRALHDEGEDQGFVPAARSERTLRMNTLAHALEKYTPDEMNEALVAMQSGTKPVSLNARVIARVTKNMLRDTFNYMKDAGVKLNDLGEDYFPRVYDTTKIEADRPGFESMLTAHGYDGKAIADKLIANGGVYTNVVDRPGMQHTKQRKLVDIPDALVQPYLKSDFIDTMSSYVYQATRRAEWARRWGDEGERLEAKLNEAQRQGATPEQLDDARKFIRGVDGTLGDDINPNLRKLFGTAIAYQNVRLLPLAIFSSVVDPVGIIVRGGSVRDGWSAFKRGLKEAIPAARGTLANDHWAEVAEIMGVVDAAALSHTMGEIYGQGMMGDTTRKINDAFFRFNLMEGFNRSMRVAATEAAARFIGKHADLKASEHSARWIAELGLRPEDIVRNPDGSVKLSERDGLTPEQASTMRAAVNKWVDGAVLRPDSVDKPVWMNDPHWALVSHLKQFTYAFHETILKRVMHEHKFGNYKPAMAMASYVPIMIAADLLKSGITPNDPEWDNDAASMLMHGVERGGVLGVGQFALDVGHGLGGLTGPTIEQLIESVEVLGGRRSFQSFALRAMPANSLYVGDGAETRASD